MAVSRRILAQTIPLRAPRPILLRPVLTLHTQHRKGFKTTTQKMAASGTSSGFPISTLDTSLVSNLPSSSPILFDAKKRKNLSFETIAQKLGRDEVAVAALFYGQAQANQDDLKNLSEILDVPLEILQATELAHFPDRGRNMPMPPRDPLVYRLYEIIQNYGYAYKAVLNEKFGDGIMSAITFSTHVEKETDEKGDWVKITWRGKWLPFSRF